MNRKTENGLLENIPCDTADEFIDKLSPVHSVFKREDLDERQTQRWLFRGQSSSEWALIPSAFRTVDEQEEREGKGVFFPKNRGRIRRLRNPSYGQQVEYEFNAVRKFFYLADGQGLELPEDSQILRRLLDQRDFESNREKQVRKWPPSELHSLMGLAQHHGVPTRLLDWTRDPNIAAYFAMRKAAEDSSKGYDSGTLCVWAISLEAYEQVLFQKANNPYSSDDEQALVKENTKGLKLITAPTAGNSNLLAQKGLFSVYVDDSMHLKSTSTYRGLEVRLPEDWGAYIGNNKTYYGSIKRFLLPQTEACRGLWLLAKLGISAVTLFPGFQGIMDGIHEEDLWKTT
jgi:hypothetical protein